MLARTSRQPPAFSARSPGARPGRAVTVRVRAEKVLIANTKGGGHGEALFIRACNATQYWLGMLPFLSLGITRMSLRCERCMPPWSERLVPALLRSLI